MACEFHRQEISIPPPSQIRDMLRSKPGASVCVPPAGNIDPRHRRVSVDTLRSWAFLHVRSAGRRLRFLYRRKSGMCSAVNLGLPCEFRRQEASTTAPSRLRGHYSSAVPSRVRVCATVGLGRGLRVFRRQETPIPRSAAFSPVARGRETHLASVRCCCCGRPP